MSARTSTIAEAAALVRDQLSTALTALPGGGDPTVRKAMLDYLSTRTATQMVSQIFGDASAETPPDVADPLRARMTSELAMRIRGVVQG